MEKPEISITCEGVEYINIDHLKDFQGNLKTLAKPEFEKLKNSILKYGFSFPVLIWKNNILDGHQRLFVVRSMLKEGYEIGEIPVVPIHAEDESEAAEKLLHLNSKYAKMTDEGLLSFIDNFDISLQDLPDLQIPDIDIGNLLINVDDFEPAGEGEQGELDKLDPKMVVCPKCGADFDSRKV